MIQEECQKKRMADYFLWMQSEQRKWHLPAHRFIQKEGTNKCIEHRAGAFVLCLVFSSVTYTIVQLFWTALITNLVHVHAIHLSVSGLCFSAFHFFFTVT